ncbi:MAG: ABC transporter permease [Silvibacterium sp.]
MRWLDKLRVRNEMLFRRRRAADQLDDELRFHVEQQVAENIAAGMGVEEARHAALWAFGKPAALRDQARETWSWSSIESLLRDARIAARTLGRSPGFALTAVGIIALGIGANVALFTVVRSVLLKPLPFRDPGRLITVYEHVNDKEHTGFHAYLPVAAGSFGEWKKAVGPGVAELALVSPWQNYNVSAEGGKLPERVDAGMCSWNFFGTLGVAPALGRGFTAVDDKPDAEATVILTSTFWKRRYSSDPVVIGRKVWLDAKPYTIIGVLPSWFTYSSAFGGNTIQIWTPVAHEAPPSLMQTFEDHEFLAVARLAPGVTQSTLISQLDTVQKRIKANHPGAAVREGVIGRPLLDDVVEDYKTPLYTLLAATGCVLFIACLNVASLLVARTAARSKEMAIRAALGGGRLRLLRERMMESLLLSVAGGATGLLLAWGAVEWLIHTRQDMNRIEAIHIDGVVIAFTVGAIVLCALFSGLISAMGSDGRRILAALQESSRTHSGGQSRAVLRKAMLVVEVGITVVLLVGAGLLLKSYQRLRTTDLGIPVDHVLTMHVSLPDARYKDDTKRVAFFEQLIEGVRAQPGVKSAGLVSTAPGQGWGGDEVVSVVEHPPQPKGVGLDLMNRGVDPGYFSAIGIPLVKGRAFAVNERLDRANVMVISQAAAKLCFPDGEDPIGRHIKIGITGETYEIVGVVGDVRWLISQPPNPTMYIPLYGNDYSHATVVVRSDRDVDGLALPIEKLIGGLDSDLPVSNVITLRETIGRSTADSQFSSVLVLAFAVIALVLAAAGLYGVLAYLITQRTTEIGIRIALGSGRDQVMGLMLTDGLRPALYGLVVGLGASALVTRLLESMLYETKPLDAWVFAAVSLLLLAVAAVACLLPSWRASRVDPMQALRAE